MRTAKTLASLYTPSGWYNDATATVRAIATASGVPSERVATVIAALSPQTSVAANVRAALAMLVGLPRVTGVLGQSWANAESERVQGPKTSAFRVNLLGDYEPVTLDVWAWRALGYEQAPDIRHRKGAGLWRHAFRTYRTAAHLLGVAPAECQAGVWSSIRTSADYRFVRNPTLSGELAKLAEPIPSPLPFGHRMMFAGSESVQALASRAVGILQRNL